MTSTNTNGKGTVAHISTPIVEWDEHCVTLNTGGERSVTTKRKMQQASNQFGLGYRVFAKRGEWFVDYGLGPVAFTDDEITFTRGRA